MIKIRFFRDFGDAPTLLVTGNATDLYEFSRELASLAASRAGTRHDLTLFLGCPIRLLALVSDSDDGLAPSSNVSAGESFEWGVSQGTWSNYAEMVRVVADSIGGGTPVPRDTEGSHCADGLQR